MTRKRTLFIMLLLTLIFVLVSIDSKVYAEEVPMTETKVTEIREVKAEKEVIATVNEKLPTVSTKDSPAESEHSPSEEASESEALTTQKPELEAVDDGQSERPSTNQDTQEEKGQESTYQTSEKAEKAQATDEVDEAEKADEPPLLNEEKQEEDSDEEGVLAEVQDQIDPSEEGKDSETVQVTEPVEPEAEEENTEATEADEKEAAEAGEILKEGETLEISELAKEPMAFGAGSGESQKSVEVSTFDQLKKAIEDADGNPTIIVITKSFTLTEALTIGKDQDITLTAKNERKEDAWEPIKRPADYADQGEKKQREIIEEGRKRGEEALEKADLDKNPLPSEDKDIIIQRAEDFVNDTLFKVLGKLTLGTDDSAVYIDGNGDSARTAFENKGSVIDVNGELVMKNAVIMNSYNKHGYTGPIRVNKGGTFTMEGGRISKNTSYEQIDYDYERPYAAGAVFVNPGGMFTMTNGLIDNNVGGMTGGVFAGDMWGSKEGPAVVEMKGGIIANNLSATRFQMGGGLNGFPASKVTINDGIIAGNKSAGPGGGISISSQYIGSPSNVLGEEKATVNTNYENYIKENKAEAFINGGLIYKNQAGTSGGGVYVDSNDVKFGKTIILDNKAGQFGGGIYVSFPPITQKLENILITENHAYGGYTGSIIGGSNGGGLWNCPTGFVHIGDGHSVYVYNNDSGSYGKDITFSEKTWYFNLNGVNIKDEFYSHISPVTEDKNIIKFLEDGPDKEERLGIPERLSYHNLYTHLKTIYSQKLIEEAWRNSQTFILGNQANNGGGVGSNANITTPKDEGEYGIEANKKWDDRIEKHRIPRNIKADLFIVPLDKDPKYVKANYGKDNSLFKYGEITLGEDNNWHSRFDTNYYNGANKEKILERLGIKDFSDIGLPDDAYQMDKGLPFTAEELAKKGYKYLVIEQGDRYFVEYDEEKPTKDKMEKAGVLEVFREYNDKYDKGIVREDKDLFFYLYDPEKQTLTRLGQTKIHENEETPGVGKTTFAHPLLLKKVSEYKYYGAYRKFTEYEGWDDYEGYHNRDRGYAIILTENEDGTLTVEVPYLWLDDYYYDVGFSARKLDKTQDYVIKGNETHSFTLTNSPWGQLDVEKSWKNIKEKDQPKSMDFYLLLEGKRVVDSFDEKGKPIYKKLTLKAEDEWKGSFKKLDPKALAEGKYSLEEDSDIFAPEWINKKEKFIVRIGYADDYHEEGQDDNVVTTTGGHFKSHIYKNGDGTYKNIKLNLFLDGEIVDTQEFTFTVDYMPDYDITYTYLNKDVEFKKIEVETFGQGIPVKYYDIISDERGLNEPGLFEYNFYLKKDEGGAYALYLPRLVINGVPYADLFIARSGEYNPTYERYERTTVIDPLPIPIEDDQNWQIKTENHYGPTHEVEILKQWLGGENKIPNEITVIITDEKGEVKEIQLTKEGNWQETLENLKGTLRKHGYSIKEVEVPGFTGDIKTEKAGLKVIGKDKDGKEITLNYMTDELKKLLAKGNYRYEVFELSEEDQLKEFNLDNINTFIKIERQKDGRYIIRYAKGISLTEIFKVNLKNTYRPPETPPSPKTRDIKVTKRWDLATGERPVDRILVELYRDGLATGKRLELNADNNWTGEFTGLEIASKENPLREYIYSIFEVGENGGLIQFGDKKFEVTYSGDMNNGFMITNKEKPETPPETPEEPPETPPETPEEPPETPEEPPETPEVPPETPGQPPRLPGKPPTGSPKTYDPGIGLYLMSSGMSVLGLYAVNKKKEN
ncbi:hypothetical protein QO008_001237 [Peptoniphilus ivorii]|uniref:Cna B-type domain-containing protein n=1 Tax=Aedoeadaptatus ivorii TaxID=54006 RepID=UPI00278B10C9|nr:Cna B-type domain-containing protein [Peptoniphilus ivorii]MDQ0508776.1 hypothetical protein [Peptoniphilus ivorii]